MKILIDTSLMKFARVFAYCKFPTIGFNNKVIPTFDAFDMANPNVFFIKEDNLTSSVVKCILERPELRTVVFADDSGKIELLKKAVGDYFNYINDYNKYGDVITYSNASFIPELACDVVCTENIEDLKIEGFTVRIFYPEVVNSKYYCGYVNEFKLKDIYKSAKVVLTKGNKTDVILSGGNPIESFCPSCLIDQPDYSAERTNILNSLTTFHLIANILETLGYNQEKNLVMERLGDFK